jgi:4-amino-4-deoxy-L-arabinose transferase-like glycosyltransferase
MYGLNPYITRLDITPYADALSTYFVSISIYLITEYMIKQNKSLLIYSGLLLGWSAFMRPANIVLFIPSSIALLLLIKESNVIKKIKTALLFLYPFTIIMTSFCLYYYIETGELFRIRYHEPYDHPYAGKIQLVHGLPCYPNTDFSLKYPCGCSFGFRTMGFADTFIVRRGVRYPAASYIYNFCFYRDAKDPLRAFLSKCPQQPSLTQKASWS